MPILGVIRETLEREGGSISGEEDFFSVARTMPLVALMPREVTPWFTALSAYSEESVSREIRHPSIERYLFAPASHYRCVSE